MCDLGDQVDLEVEAEKRRDPRKCMTKFNIPEMGKNMSHFRN